jgi:NAD(P)-dependent dehydrogenase (short-subunit alcohol dehydrogenase family)
MTPSRRVLITAAAGGIGLAIAKAFAAEGDRVHICDIDEPALARVTAEHDAITGSVCDISDRSAVESFVPEAAEALGGIDVLVNNAGVSGPTTAVQDLDPDAWEAVLAVNLTGTFNVTRHAIPHLKRSDAGVILIMSSLAGRFGYENRSPYATAKRGLLGFAETLALELGQDGVRVNAIAPGAVLGERMQSVLRGRAEATGRTMEELTTDALANQSIKRFVDPDDIAALAVFLASDHAKSITGQTIAIDGGSKAAQ